MTALEQRKVRFCKHTSDIVRCGHFDVAFERGRRHAGGFEHACSRKSGIVERVVSFELDLMSNEVAEEVVQLVDTGVDDRDEGDALAQPLDDRRRVVESSRHRESDVHPR